MGRVPVQASGFYTCFCFSTDFARLYCSHSTARVCTGALSKVMLSLASVPTKEEQVDLELAHSRGTTRDGWTHEPVAPFPACHHTMSLVVIPHTPTGLLLYIS